MNLPLAPSSYNSFTSFGELLKYLRRRQRLTQLELSIAVGYSESQITRLEKNQRLPDLTAIKALFIPALHLEYEPQLTARFLELAQSARQEEAPTLGVPPYKGLLYFDEVDSELFFGREALTAQLTRHVLDLVRDASTRFLAVVGASGSGKSSLVRAGLAVTLQRAGWETRVFTPTAIPMRMLEVNLNSVNTKDAERVLILVDQFEEVFTLCRDEIERIAFIEKLLSSARDESKKRSVVVALRADFYPHCAQYPLLRQAVAAEQEYIGGMTSEELRRTIEEPARRGGWEFEPGLVDIILQDLSTHGSYEPEPGALPLLSHALLATWERRRGRNFTLDGYRASGGVRGAIAETAESVFTDQLDRTQQEIARDVFLRLTELGEGTEDTRRRATLNELMRQIAEATQLRAVLNTLAEARLIILNEDSAEVAHEALIREWGRLHEWLTQDREGLLLHRHLTESTQDWERRGRDPSDLYRGARLAQAREWATTNEGRLNTSERDFLAASIEQEEHDALEREAHRQRELEAAQALADSRRERLEDQKLATSRLKRRAFYLTGALVLTIILAVVALFFGEQARQSAQTAQSRELSALAISQLNSHQDSALLLSVEAWRSGDSYQTFDALLRMLQFSPHLTRILFGHSDIVHSVAFSPDGKTLASGSGDATIRLWDVASHQSLGEPLQGHSSGVFSVAFSPDGKTLASSSKDRTIRLWDVASRQALGEPLQGHSDFVYCVVFSPDGKILASSSRDATIRLWDVASRQPLGEPLEWDRGVTSWSVAFSPDGKTLASGDSDNKIRLWDIATGQQLGEPFHGHSAALISVAFSPDGKTLASASLDEFIYLWDVASRQPLGEPLQGHSVIFSPDGKALASGYAGNSIRLWSMTNHQPIGEPLRGHSGDIWSIAFSSDGVTLASGGEDHNIRLWDLNSRQELYETIRGMTAVLSVAFSPDGRLLASGSHDFSTAAPPLHLWEVASRQPYGGPLEVFTGNQWSDPVPPNLCPAGGCKDWLVRETGSQLSVSFSPDGKILASGSSAKTIHLFDVASGQPLGDPLQGHTGPVSSIVFTPDGKNLISGSYDKTIRLWDVASRQPLGEPLLGHSGEVTSVAISPDGRILASGSLDTTIRLWDVARRQPLGEPLQGHSDGVYSVAFSPDGKILASGSLDTTIRLWDVASRLPLGEPLQGHTGNVRSISFSPDGKILASASWDYTIRLWGVASGVPLGEPLRGRSTQVYSVDFSPDGNTLASAYTDGSRLWDVNPQSWLERICGIVGRNFTQAEWRLYFPGVPYRKTCEQWPIPAQSEPIALR